MLEVLQQLLPVPDPGAAASAATTSGQGSRDSEGGPPARLYLVSSMPRRGSASAADIESSFGPCSAVDMSHCFYRENHEQATSSYILRSELTGSRTIVSYNYLPDMTADELARVVDHFGAGRGSDTWWHFEVRTRYSSLLFLPTSPSPTYRILLPLRNLFLSSLL